MRLLAIDTVHSLKDTRCDCLTYKSEARSQVSVLSNIYICS